MGVNVERFAGFIAGITFAVILSCVLMIIVNKNKRIKTEEDELLAYGKALLGACEIKELKTGQAIKTRKGMKK